MTDRTHRKPAAFPIAPEPGPQKAGEAEKSRTAKAPASRPPQAVGRHAVVTVTPPEDDPFANMADDGIAAPLPPEPALRFTLGRLFLAALGLLVSLAAGLWLDGLIRDLFARADWLGWTAAGLTALAALALLGILVRELAALRRLASVTRLRIRGADAAVHKDSTPARALVNDLCQFLESRPETADGRKMLKSLEGDIIDGPDLLRLAETELMVPLDIEARRLVLDAAKRVSVVTAVSPRALVDVGYVIFEAARLIRRIANVYGGRPGTLGFMRLSRSVIAHLAVTGTIAVGDSMVSQVLGHGVAARLSARLGEGVVNGLMTVRIGIAAMDTARPLPFSAVKRPAMADFLSALVKPRASPGSGSDRDRR
ncbi:MAG: TIGR01620 family protein [Notoacmeibacter sp.]|nr:TIGR01620 family protein [Notoacmeibacter sp.]